MRPSPDRLIPIPQSDRSPLMNSICRSSLASLGFPSRAAGSRPFAPSFPSAIQLATKTRGWLLKCRRRIALARERNAPFARVKVIAQTNRDRVRYNRRHFCLWQAQTLVRTVFRQCRPTITAGSRQTRSLHAAAHGANAKRTSETWKRDFSAVVEKAAPQLQRPPLSAAPR